MMPPCKRTPYDSERADGRHAGAWRRIAIVRSSFVVGIRNTEYKVKNGKTGYECTGVVVSSIGSLRELIRDPQKDGLVLLD